jgi:hypothetical protein
VVDELPHLVLAVLLDQQPVPVQQRAQLPVVAAVGVVLARTELSLPVLQLNRTLVKSPLLRDAFVCVDYRLVSLRGQSRLYFRQLQVSRGVVVVGVCEAVVAADGDVLLVVEVLDAAHPLLLPVLDILEVEVALQLSVDLPPPHQQLLPIVKGLHWLRLHPRQTLGGLADWPDRSVGLEGEFALLGEDGLWLFEGGGGAFGEGGRMGLAFFEGCGLGVLLHGLQLYEHFIQLLIGLVNLLV